MTHLAPRPWLSDAAAARHDAIALPADPVARIEDLTKASARLHDQAHFNLNPATNVMNPRAEALLASGIGSRPSLGHPGDKYEMGLGPIEEIEVIAAQLASRVFNAPFVEVRVPSGALANMFTFMALAKPGDSIIAPSAQIGGHVTHHAAGCAGLYGLTTHAAPVDAARYSVDLDATRALAHKVKPKIITIGASLNLLPHPVADLRAIADEVGAILMFDAAHLCGLIAGGTWPNPLDQGAHVMTMSTYKSLGGPAGGLIVTTEADIAQRLDAVAFPGMTANFDAAKTAALAVTLQDWLSHGADYAAHMEGLAKAMADAATDQGLPVFQTEDGPTKGHSFALEAAPFGGGQAMAKRLEVGGFLTCGIGLPLAAVPGDMNGLRLGTPELARRGVEPADAPRLMDLFARALRGDPANVAAEVAALRATFTQMRYAG